MDRGGNPSHENFLRNYLRSILWDEVGLLFGLCGWLLNFVSVTHIKKHLKSVSVSMPWTILPALLVLWGVVWMFFWPWESDPNFDWDLYLNDSDLFSGLTPSQGSPGTRGIALSPYELDESLWGLAQDQDQTRDEFTISTDTQPQLANTYDQQHSSIANLELPGGNDGVRNGVQQAVNEENDDEQMIRPIEDEQPGSVEHEAFLNDRSQLTCSICDRKFNRSDNLRRHMLKSCPKRRVPKQTEHGQEEESSTGRPSSQILPLAIIGGQENRGVKRSHQEITSDEVTTEGMRERLRLESEITAERKKQCEWEEKRTKELEKQLALKKELLEIETKVLATKDGI